jgi:hypothetical protein
VLILKIIFKNKKILFDVILKKKLNCMKSTLDVKKKSTDQL